MKRGRDWGTLEDVQEGEHDTCRVDQYQEKDRSPSEERVRLRHSEVEDEDGGFGGHEYRVVADRKDVFGAFKREFPFRKYVCRG